MLYRLPPELLDHILLLACPPSTWPDRFDDDRERRTVLWACCLVSKAVRDRAQPLLWRKIVVHPHQDHYGLLDLLKSGDVSDLKMHVRVLCAQELYVQKLCATSGIASLALRNTSIRWHMTFHAPCRTITSLSLSSITFFSVSESNGFFSVGSFPSLRALAVSPAEALAEDGDFYPPLPPDLLQQLDCVQVKLNKTIPLPSSLLTTDTPDLFTIPSTLDSSTLQYLLRIPLKRIRIVPRTIEDGSDFATAVPTLSNLITLLVDSPSKPLSVHLPYFWRAVNPPSYPDVLPLVRGVLERCQRRSVEVVWCREGQETESAVSEEFWEFAKRIKAEREGVQ